MHYSFKVKHKHPICLTGVLTLADLELSRSQLNQEQGEVVSRERNCRKLEHANKRLKEEVKTLQEHIAHETISRMQMEAYKKEVDEKVGIILLPTHLHIIITFYSCRPNEIFVRSSRR